MALIRKTPSYFWRLKLVCSSKITSNKTKSLSRDFLPRLKELQTFFWEIFVEKWKIFEIVSKCQIVVAVARLDMKDVGLKGDPGRQYFLSVDVRGFICWANIGSLYHNQYKMSSNH